MNIKTMFYVLIVVANAVNLYSSQSNRQSPQRQLTPEELERLFDRSRPRDKNKTPTSPDIIEHDGGIFGGILGGQNFYRKRIYYSDKNEPRYARIYEHMKNPKFNDVKIIIRQKVSYFTLFLSYIPFLDVNTNDYFEYVGNFWDEGAQRKLIKSIIRNGGVWCPDFGFVGGTRETGVCDMRDEFKKLEQEAALQQKVFEDHVKLQKKMSKI